VEAVAAQQTIPGTIAPRLAEPIVIGGVRIRNRVVSSGHDTTMVEHGMITDDLVAYQEARAIGGAGLIVVQVAGVHETARYTSHVLMATDDSVIPGYRTLVDAVHRHGATVFGQIFHPGREITESSDGTAPVALAPSAVPTERFSVIPRPMTREQIEEVLDGYASAAVRLRKAGVDGVELVASHGYLPAQFLNPAVNLRDDEYGGSFDNRLRFLAEGLRRVRAATGPDFVVGMRISGDERAHDGLRLDVVTEVCAALDREGLMDYVSVCAGSSSSLSGALHIAAPMTEAAAYVAPLSVAVKRVVGVPVIVAGRVNQPQEAEALLRDDKADMVAMTRALICDPELPVKTFGGRHDDVRACIGCNQACMGHFQAGYPISCIQHPETGRERRFGTLTITPRSKSVMVVGGGPGGLKAAAVAAARGHAVTVYEAGRRPGGQVLLAERVPGRGEFGGAITNLLAETERLGVRIETGVHVDAAFVAAAEPDVVVLATGARPFVPALELMDDPVVLQAVDVIAGTDVPNGRILVADSRGDWTGLGAATQLALAGHDVTLAVTGFAAGDHLQQYVRTAMIRQALRAKVTILPNARLIGVDEDTAYLQHTLSEEPILLSDVAAAVLSHGSLPCDDVVVAPAAGRAVHEIGDRVAARTVEEAILEGLVAGSSI
jgi:2,4-dienoyl-CoA reductase-like NADH-dependent reductase (Old Yellow Enzyme family)/thioredoxin reductase